MYSFVQIQNKVADSEYWLEENELMEKKKEQAKGGEDKKND